MTPYLYELADWPDGMRHSPLMVAARIAHKVTVDYNTALLTDLRDLATAFDDAGVSYAVLKGPILLGAVYHSVGVRTVGDIDVLVPATHLSRVIDILTDLGFIQGYMTQEGIVPILERNFHAGQHHLTNFLREGKHVTAVEVHQEPWNRNYVPAAFGPPLTFENATEWGLWRSSLPGGFDCTTLAKAAFFIQLLCHTYHHAAVDKLWYLAAFLDIRNAWCAWRNDMSIQEIHDVVRTWDVGAEVQWAAEVVHKLLDLEDIVSIVPSDVNMAVPRWYAPRVPLPQDGKIKVSIVESEVSTLQRFQTHVTLGPAPGTDAELSATGAIWRSESGIHVSLDVQDCTPCFNAEISTCLWEQDCVEMMICRPEDGRMVRRIGLAPRSGLLLSPIGVMLDSTGEPVSLNFTAKEVNGGYRVAIVLPWDWLGINPFEGGVFGLDIQVNDCVDPRGGRRRALAWVGGRNLSWTEPDVLCKIYIHAGS